MRRPPSSPLFPYTTLFRSVDLGGSLRGGHGAVARARQDDREGGEGPRPEGAVAVAQQHRDGAGIKVGHRQDRKSTRLNSSHVAISYAVFCLKKKNTYSVRA